MSNTNTTTTASAPAPAAAPNIFQQIEANLESDAQAALAWFKTAWANAGTFLSKVAAGAEIAVTDIEDVAQTVAAHLGLVTSIISAASTAASALPSSDAAAAQKALADLNTTANDVALLSTALSSGSTSGDPTIVTSAVSAISAVQQLGQLASQTAAAVTTAAGSAPSATQAVTPATPGPTA